MLPLAKKAKLDETKTDYQYCIICQCKTSEDLIDSPQSHDKVIEFIKERASYNDTIYPDIWNRLKNDTADSLKEKSATWHRSCYQSAVHTGKSVLSFSLTFNCTI